MEYIKSLVLLMLAAFLLLGAGCAQGPWDKTPYTPDEIRQDGEVTRNVTQALGVYSEKIAVETRRGRVYLSGQAVDPDERDEVLRRAEKAQGVRSIQDDMEVIWPNHSGWGIR